MTPGRRPNLPRGALLWSLLVGSVAAAAYALTLPDYGMVSDEGNYFQSSVRLARWVHDFAGGVGAGDPARALRPEAIAESWTWFPERIPHPPFSREVAGLSALLFQGRMDPLVAYRFLGALVAGALAAAVAAWAGRAAGAVGGLVGGAAFLLMPRVFAHAHFATTDVLLSALFFGALFCAAEVRRAPLAWAGLLWGLALATKFSAALLPLVLVPWLCFFRRERLRELPVFVVVAALVFAFVNPAVWVDPVGYAIEYVRQGLGRRAIENVQLPTWYLGSVHVFRPPWHYPVVMLLLTLPPGLLVLAVCGAVAGLGRRTTRPAAAMALLCVGVFLGALELPSAPLHDDVRLFLPIFPFLALLAGVGAGWLADLAAGAARRRQPLRAWRTAVLGLLLLALAEPALAIVRLHPFQASYFNALAGGVAGAERRGLEVTTLKEVLTPDVYADLNRALGPGASLEGGPFLYEDLVHAQGIGWLRRDVDVRPEQPADYVLVVNRRGWFRAADLALMRAGRPAYAVTLEGVSLVALFRLR